MVSSKLFKRPVAENESSLPEEECDTPIVIQARRSTNSFGLNGSLTIPFQKMLQNIFNTQQTCSISARKSMMEFQQITFLLQKYCGEFRDWGQICHVFVLLQLAYTAPSMNEYKTENIYFL
jgi:hypothetical protein